MKKALTILLLSLMMAVGMFAQEADNTYWCNEADVDGRLLTFYFCKTDAQFDNTFKSVVKDKLGITYSFREPNWNSIKSGLVSIEYIKKNFPKFYKFMTDDNNIVNLDNYKYYWCIQNVDGMYLVNVAKRINDIVYMSISIMYGYYQWTYTLEALELFESVL